MRLLLAALAALLFTGSAEAGTLYIDTGGAATNSCSRDTNNAALSGTGDATVAASVVQLTLGTDLSGVNATAGSATQDTIYIAQATNTNTKVFWITGKDDGLDQVTVSVAPTGVTASNWAIGGRCVLTNASQEGALRAGDTVIFNNSPASQAATSWTFRIAGDSASGYATIIGKTGVRPVLTTSGSGNSAVFTNALAFVRISNLEVQQTHASSGIGIQITGPGNLIDNVKVSDAGTIGITDSSFARFVNVEVTGTVGDCMNFTNVTQIAYGLYLHDCGGDGLEITSTSPSVVLLDSAIDSNVGRGIYQSSASVTSTSNFIRVSNTTIYGNGNSGLEIADADTNASIVNDIFTENGNAAGEYNVEWAAGSGDFIGYHAYNTYWCTGLSSNNCTSTALNILGITVDYFVASSELLSDPLMAAPTTGNFALGSTSPAKGTGFPGTLLGSTTTGYASMGAAQVQSSSVAGGGIIGGGL